MAERKRDYHAEYERRKANGWVRPPRDSKEEYRKAKERGYQPDYAKQYEQRKEREKRWSLVVPNEEVPGVLQVLERCRCKTPSELIRKLGRGELFVYASNVTKNIMDNDDV